MVTAEPRWVSAHLFHQGDLDALLVTAVHPLVGGLVGDGLADGWFYLRHWEAGGHVRLRVRAASPAGEHAVRDRVVAGCLPYLDAHPSVHRTSPEQYTQSAAKLAALEGASRYAPALAAPDGVAFVPYRPERDRYGAAMSAVERHFEDSSRLALELLRSGPDTGRRDTAAFGLLLLAWFAAEPEPGRLAPRVVADVVPPDPEGATPALWRAAVDRRYRGQRERLAGIATRMQALAAGPAVSRSGLFAEWTASVRTLRDAVVAAGEPALPMLDRCAHLVCNRLGGSLVEEGYLRVLAARTVHLLAGVPV